MKPPNLERLPYQVQKKKFLSSSEIYIKSLKKKIDELKEVNLILMGFLFIFLFYFIFVNLVGCICTSVS